MTIHVFDSNKKVDFPSFQLGSIEKKLLRKAREQAANGADDELVSKWLDDELSDLDNESAESVKTQIMSKLHEKSPNKGNKLFKSHQANDELDAVQENVKI